MRKLSSRVATGSVAIAMVDRYFGKGGMGSEED
jgi:hypothetical protein